MHRAVTSDDEDPGKAADVPDALLLRREARAAKLMGGAAVVFAASALGLLLVVLLQPARPSTRVAAADEMIGLAAAPGARLAGPPAGGRPRASGPRGWCRVYSPSAAVRRGAEADSPQVHVLPQDSLVYIQETHGQRARISQPVPGWVDTATSDGVTVVYEDPFLHDHDEKVDLQVVLQSDQSKARRENIRAKVAKLTATQQRLAGAMKQMKARAKALRGAPGVVTDAVQQRAPEVAKELGGAARQVVDSLDAQKVLDDIKGKPEVQDLLR